MVKLLFKTLLISLVFFGSWVIIIHLWKAWNDSTLKATTGDELTAERWNALVDKVWWKVYESDWFNVTTASNVNLVNSHNTYLINHNLWTDKVQVTVFWRVSEWWEVTKVRTLDLYYNWTNNVCWWYVVRKVENNQLTIWVPRTNCNSNFIFYALDTNSVLNSPTSWQYKVIVKALN